MIQARTSSASAVDDSLSDGLLGTSFLLYQRDGQFAGYREFPDADSAVRNSTTLTEQMRTLSRAAIASIGEHAREVTFTQRPSLKRISPDLFVWAVPLLSNTRTTAGQVAIELIPDQSDALLAVANRLADCVWNRDQKCNALKARIKEDTAQLSWLRQLATNLELSQSGNSVERIAESVLPSLRRLIHSSAIVFVRDVSVSGLDHDLPMIWQTGSLRLARRRVLAAIDSLLDHGPERVVVRNAMTADLNGGRFPDIHSCILVPVMTETTRLGWLLAVNKTVPTSRARSSFPCDADASSLSSGIFGSSEVSLMNATAVVLAAHGSNCGLFHEKELLLRGVIRSMINAIDAKDSYTCGHSDRVAEFARLIAQELHLDRDHCEQIYMTGLLHDVGKIGVPDEVLNKPGQLTDSEFELIKQHPVIGYEILKHLENLDYVLPGVLHHHEAMDGSGYPHGLQGTEIPLEARILAVADAYDAMTSDRPYRRGMPTEKAEAILRNGSGRQWDPDCVEAFFRTAISVRLIASQTSSPFSPVPAVSGNDSSAVQMETAVATRNWTSASSK